VFSRKDGPFLWLGRYSTSFWGNILHPQWALLGTRTKYNELQCKFKVIMLMHCQYHFGKVKSSSFSSADTAAAVTLRYSLKCCLMIHEVGLYPGYDESLNHGFICRNLRT